MRNYMSGQRAMEMIADAFGLSHSTMRVVIDIKPNEVARIIRIEALTEVQASVLVDALKQCNVEVI